MAAGGGGGNSGAIRAGKAFVEIHTDDKPFMKGLNAVKGKFLSWGGSLAKVGAGFAAAGGAIVTPLLAFFEKAISKGVEFKHLSDRLQTTTEIISAMGFAADQTGVSMETLEAGLKKMQVNISKGGNLAGFDIGSLKGKGLDEQFGAIASIINKLPDAETKAEALRAVFGKSGQDLAAMVKEFEELNGEAKELGFIYKSADAEKAETIERSLSKMWRAIKGIGSAVGKAVLPFAEDIKMFAGMIMQGAQAISKFIKENQRVIAIVFAVGAALVAIGTVLGGIAAAFALVGAAISGAVALWGALTAVIGFVLSPIGLVIAGLAAVAASAAYLIYNFTSFGEIFEATWGGVLAAIRKGDLSLAMEIAWLGIKLVWQTGIAWLKDLWTNFNTWMIDSFLRVVGGIADLFKDIVGDFSKEIATLRDVNEGFRKAAIDEHNANAKKTRAELDAKIAEANKAREKAEVKAAEITAAGGAVSEWGKEVKGAFGANVSRGTLGFGDGKSIAEHTKQTAKNTGKTNDLLKGLKEPLWDD